MLRALGHGFPRLWLPLVGGLHWFWTLAAPALLPTLLSGGVAAMLASSTAAQEALLFATASPVPGAFALLALALAIFGATLWYAARFLLYSRYPFQRPALGLYRRALARAHRTGGPRLRLAAADLDRFAATVRRWLPRVLVLPPPIGSAYTLAHAGEPRAAAALICVGLATFLLVTFRSRLIKSLRQPARFEAPGIERGTWLTICIWLLSFIAVVLSIVRGVLEPTLIGPIAVALLGLALLLLPLMLLVHLAFRSRRLSVLGVFILAVAWAAVLAYKDKTDNHWISGLGPASPAPTRGAQAASPIPPQSPASTPDHRRTVEQHLAGWLLARQSVAGNVDRPYPLIVVAAQGGGIRAAYWTAASLAAMSTREPAFTCHLFAIAGISGGSMGALVYQGLLDRLPGAGCRTPDSSVASATYLLDASRDVACDDKAPPAALPCAVQAVLQGDMLSPLMAGLFFPDLAARYWPTRLGLLKDRQTYLEAALANHWDDATEKMGDGRVGDGVRGDFVGFVRPEVEDTRRPALFLISTEAGEGRRWIASDLRFDANLIYEARDTLTFGRIHGETGGERLALPAATAAGLSFRFPFLSPAGGLEEISLLGDPPPAATGTATPPPRRQFLDGGVVESSGALTAAELLNAVSGWCRRTPARGTLACTVYPNALTVGNCDPGKDATGRFRDCRRPTTVYVRPAALALINDDYNPPPGNAAEPPGLMDRIGRAFPELSTPALGLGNTRTGRGREGMKRLVADRNLYAGRYGGVAFTLRPTSAQGAKIAVADGTRCPANHAVPLSWVLIPCSYAIMDEAIKAGLKEAAMPGGSVLPGDADVARWLLDLFPGRSPQPPTASPDIRIGAGSFVLGGIAKPPVTLYDGHWLSADLLALNHPDLTDLPREGAFACARQAVWPLPFAMMLDGGPDAALLELEVGWRVDSACGAPGEAGVVVNGAAMTPRPGTSEGRATFTASVRGDRMLIGAIRFDPELQGGAMPELTRLVLRVRPAAEAMADAAP